MCFDTIEINLVSSHLIGVRDSQSGDLDDLHTKKVNILMKICFFKQIIISYSVFMMFKQPCIMFQEAYFFRIGKEWHSNPIVMECPLL